MSWVKEEFGNMLIVLFSWQIFHVEQEQGCLFRFLFFFFWFPTECLSPRWKSVVIRQLQVCCSQRGTHDSERGWLLWQLIAREARNTWIAMVYKYHKCWRLRNKLSLYHVAVDCFQQPRYFNKFLSTFLGKILKYVS